MNIHEHSFIANYSVVFVDFFGVSLEVADFIACQIALESSFGKSEIASLNKNLFGMKMPKRRITTAKSCKRGFASYSGTMLSCIDYFLWLSYNKFDQRVMSDLELFKTKLQACGYCPESDYINKITNLLNSYKNGQESSNK